MVGLARGLHPPEPELLLEGWTVDDDGPLSPPRQVWAGSVGQSHRRLDALDGIDRGLWETERAAHTAARLSSTRRLPVYLNAIERVSGVPASEG
jgi:hypothetical protein